MKIVIIEDEHFIAEDLASTITDLRSNYEVIKVIPSIKEANNYFNNNNDFDLIFSDIHLGDGLSFEIFKTNQLKAPVIFCTAFDNHAIEAFKANGIDYILKPVNRTNILTAIEKFERLKSTSNTDTPNISALLDLFKNKALENKNKSILIHFKDKIIPIKLEDIAVFYIKNEITTAMDFTGKSYSIGETLEEIESFNLPILFRANRQFIINRKAVKDAAQHFSRKLMVNLNLPISEQITISKEKTPQFLKWLKNN